jgi:hypothetical protein|tara:strand:+ start:399 stop:584 length:186 start_codon:yes stop_codon:yes gene_type:complete
MAAKKADHPIAYQNERCLNNYLYRVTINKINMHFNSNTGKLARQKSVRCKGQSRKPNYETN